MNERDKGFTSAVWDFVNSHWVDISSSAIALYTIFRTGSIPESAPETVKVAAEAAGFDKGGKHSTADEVTFKLLLPRLSEQQEYFLLNWLGFTFPSESSDPWLRDEAEKALEEFRVQVRSMVTPAKNGTITKTVVNRRDDKGKPIDEDKIQFEGTIIPEDDSQALAYLKRLANEIIKEVKVAAGVTTTKDFFSLPEEEQTKAEEFAFAKITRKMRLQGSPWMPRLDEQSTAMKMRKIFLGFAQKVKNGGKAAYDKWPDLKKRVKKKSAQLWEELNDPDSATRQEIDRFAAALHQRAERERHEPKSWIRQIMNWGFKLD
ncbi:MAG: hypothetical protein ACOC4E_01665 [Patescibacteria group bacterium]